MDDHVKRMLKLIEEDADSFAQKAQMYFQKRPELVNLVEEFYRMYRALAERYDHVTGELRKNLPSPSSHQKLSRHLSSHSPDILQKENDDSSSSDAASDSDSRAESDSDRSSANNFPDLSGDQALTSRIAVPEMGLREAKEKLLMQPEVSADGLAESFNSDMPVDLRDKITIYETELGEANERLRISEGEIARLKSELQSYKKSEMPSDGHAGSLDSDRQESRDADAAKVQLVEEELRMAKVKLQQSEEEISYLKYELVISKVAEEKMQSLEHKLELAEKDASTYKSRLDVEKKEVSKLQERMGMLKTSLQDRDYEIRALKTAVADAEEKIFPEKAQINVEMSKLAEERREVEEQLKELETRGRWLEEEVRRISKENGEMQERIEKNEEEGRRRDGKIEEMERHMEELHMEQVKLRARMEEMRGMAKALEEEVERQRVAISEGAELKREAIRQLCLSLDHYRDGYVSLRRAIAVSKSWDFSILKATQQCMSSSV